MPGAMRMAVVGLGYVGVPLAATFARAGLDVVGIDIDEAKVDAINEGRSPLKGREPGLADRIATAVSQGKLRATTDVTPVSRASAVLVAVETPLAPGGEDPDYRPLRSALRSSAPHLRKNALVSIESTVAPGTMDRVVKPLLERGSDLSIPRDLQLVHAPERVTAGKLLWNLEHLDRVVGGADDRSCRKAARLYARITSGRIHVTDWITAEIAKTAENAYWDVQIAFANEIALLCEELGANAYRVRELVNTSPFRNMLLPGAGVGGPCIPKDPWLLVGLAWHVKPQLIPAARSINEFMPIRMALLVEEALRAAGRPIKGAQVTILGFAYKANTEDSRNSPAIGVVRALRKRGADVTIHDPYARSARGYVVLKDLRKAVRGADALALVTAHTAYRRMDLGKLGRSMRHKVVVDGRDLWSRHDMPRGFVYRGIGKGNV